LKKQSQFNRSAFGVLRTAKTKLKKQSQFAGGKIGVNSFTKGYYGNILLYGARKNKAKTNPIKACPERSRMGQLPVMELFREENLLF